MVATRFTRSERRALRWMRRRGLGLQPSEPAFDLLAARLDVRFRAGAVVWSVFLVFAVTWQLTTDPGDLELASPWQQFARTVVPVVVFGLALTGFTRWCTRADRALARSMPTRVTRTGAVPARVVLGPVAIGALGVVVALEAVVALLLVSRASAADAAAFAGGVLAVGAICAAALQVVLRRATVALDTSALAVDERLRAFDALYALWPVGWSALALITPLDLRGVHGASVIVTLAAAAMVAGSCVLLSHPAQRVRYGVGRARSRA